LEAGAGFVNNMPVFIASDPAWAKRFEERRLPLMGDDIKSQLGATIIHRMLVDLSEPALRTTGVGPGVKA
jgi:myo-inositol-1-phosphate synthase